MRLLGICLASFSSGSYLTYSYDYVLTFGFRLGRVDVPPTFNNILASIDRRSQCWVRPSLSPTPTKPHYSIKAILPRVQVPQDWWEHSFGGRCVALEYAPGLGYRLYVPCHLLVVFGHLCVTQLIGSASSHPVNLLLHPSSQFCAPLLPPSFYLCRSLEPPCYNSPSIYAIGY
jgi:hypothetical protein